jgi:biopolymer transport protein TolQ
MNPADAIAAGSSMDMSFWGMFWGAHFVVKAVMLGLLAASLWSWAIIINKFMLIGSVERSMDRFED